MEETNLLPTLAEASLPGQPTQELPAELREDESTIEKIKRVDEQREGFPGEHWLVLGLGIGLWYFTRKHRHLAVRTVGSFAATALVARAASGRDGLGKVLRWTPLGRGIRSCPPSADGQAQRR
jgi:hypothetical protein